MGRKQKDDVQRRTGSRKKKNHYEKMGKYKKNVIAKNQYVEPIIFKPKNNNKN
jgi:hypothetical protein